MALGCYRQQRRYYVEYSIIKKVLNIILLEFLKYMLDFLLRRMAAMPNGFSWMVRSGFWLLPYRETKAKFLKNISVSVNVTSQ